MQRFIAFVLRYKNYVTLIALMVMSLSFMSVGNMRQLGGFRAVVVGSIGWMQSLFAWIPNPVALKSENTALRELNLQLSVESARSRQAMVENAVLRRMLALPDMTEFRLIAADVSGKTTTQLRNYATINKGTDAGVREGMACITDAGLVGRVIGTSRRYAVVQLLLNRDTRVAAKVQRSRVDGIVTWEGEATVALKNVPKSFDVQVGDVIVTSNYSSIYPQNLVVGRVTNVEDENQSLFRRVVIEPAVNFSTVEQVFVIDYVADQERLLLEREAEQRVRQRNNAN